MNRLQQWWAEVPDSWKIEGLSMWHTFLAGFVLAVAYSLDSHNGTPWTTDAVISILLAATRSGIKVVWVQFVKMFE